MDHRPPTWPPEDDARLTELWASGLSTAAIGIAMGRTKNSIVGRAHRLKLPGRASPIVPRGTRKAKAGQRKPRIRKSRPPLLHPRMSSAEALARAVRAERPVCVAPPPIVPRAVLASRHAGGCKWPLGDPKADGFRFCEAPRHEGRPYCTAHVDKAMAHRERAA